MLEKLNLVRPIIFFDLETTGTSIARDRIIEISAIKIMPDRSKNVLYKRFNPGIPIEPGATAAHGITDEMVANEQPLSKSLDELIDFFSKSDLGGFNITRFDIPLLVEELLRNGASQNPIESARYIDSMSIYHKKETRTLSDALKFYANEEHINAHSAEADVEATIKILDGQLSLYDDIQPEIDFLHEYSTGGKERVDYAGCFSRDDEGDLIFTFGVNKGKKILENTGMLNWMLSRDFTEHTKGIARKILNGELR